MSIQALVCRSCTAIGATLPRQQGDAKALLLHDPVGIDRALAISLGFRQLGDALYGTCASTGSSRAPSAPHADASSTVVAQRRGCIPGYGC
jgi:hypothetical protein